MRDIPIENRYNIVVIERLVFIYRRDYDEGRMQPPERDTGGTDRVNRTARG
jgi:hypothetical protein